MARPAATSLLLLLGTTLPRLMGCDSGPAPPPVPPRAAEPATAQSPSTRPALTDPAPRGNAIAPRQTVLDAVAASLGNANRAKFDTGRTTTRVLSDQPVGATVDATIVDTFQLPGRLRRELNAVARQANRAPEKVAAVYIWNGDRGWRTAEDGSLMPVTSTVPAHNLFPDPYLLVLENAAAPDAVLLPNGESTWDGRRAVSVRAQNPGSAARELFFDADSKLLIGGRGEMPDPMTGRVTNTSVNITFSDFRDIHRARLPMRMVTEMQGRRLFDVSVLDFKPLENVDERLFLGPAPAQ
jgi:hypothetical protein